VGFDYADNHVGAGLSFGLGTLQHLVSLADAGGSANEDLEPADLMALSPRGFQQRIRRRSFVRVTALICHTGNIVLTPDIA
jgi:hypothetical protein